MGVYIEDMEKPKSCAECEWLRQHIPGGQYWCKRTNTMVHATWASANLNPVPQSCPVIPVPEHGRLIDADALFKEIGMDGRFGVLEAICIQSIILDTPTIIPADKEDN